ncbi:MAG: LLM class flavin-dependent oxidoreductase [Acidobacteria bacterium]|nr:LLM class flavin-dependent oxidoreductase [Acidobacteriota bacterium]
MKLGVILPTFRDDVDDAFEVAAQCDEFGIDGVFAYDHLWPMGSPTRPSLAPFPVLAAIAARHPTLHVGPLVARVGMVATAHLVTQFRTLAAVAPGRVVAAIGTGDAKSRDELEAYGLNYANADARRELVAQTALVLRDEMPVWIGAGATPTNDLARELGVALNVWDTDLATTTSLVAHGTVTWAGPARAELPAWVSQLDAAGVQWAVLAPGVDVAALANWRT